MYLEHISNANAACVSLFINTTDPQMSKVGLLINNTIKQDAMNGHCIIFIIHKRRKTSKNNVSERTHAKNLASVV